MNAWSPADYALAIAGTAAGLDLVRRLLNRWAPPPEPPPALTAGGSTEHTNTPTQEQR